MEDAIGIHRPKRIMAIASSKATTPKRVVVKGPLALYSLTTVSVAAGAVAEAMDPSTMENGKNAR